MADPQAVHLADAFRLAIAAGDAETITALVRRWLPIERQLQGKVQDLAAHFAALAEQGQTPSWSQAFQDDRFQSLLTQLQSLLDGYGRDAEQLIDESQRQRSETGWRHAQILTQAASGVTVSLERLPVEAVENIVALARTGKPLATLLEARYPLAAQGMLDRLITGTALGWNPRKTARAMMEQGASQGLNHVLLVARDQQIRAYRTASLQAYRQSGLVIGYKRLAARQPRTCLACLALDGKFYRLDEEMPLHPQDRCTRIPVLEHPGETTWATGREWFAAQPEAVQRQMMGNQRYEAWRTGKFSFDDLVTIKKNELWGDSATPTPLQKLPH